MNNEEELKAEVERLTSMVEHWRNEAEYAQERIDKLLAERDDWRLACEIKAKYMIERQLNE